MTTTTTHAPGTFAWPELATSDQDGARRFYTALFGWTADDQPMGEGETYTMLKKGDAHVGALYRMRKEEAGAPPHWNAYVTVTSADQATQRARELGAQVFMEPFDVMDAGRMAVLQDPTGAVFQVWEGKRHPGAGVLNEPGALIWTELMTRDPGAARAFYTALFGWRADDTTMPGGTYTIFRRGEAGAGGMMAMPAEVPAQVPAHWLPYFGVERCDATVSKAQSLGARVMMPATEIEKVGRFALLSDPQGAVFAVLEPKP